MGIVFTLDVTSAQLPVPGSEEKDYKRELLRTELNNLHLQARQIKAQVQKTNEDTIRYFFPLMEPDTAEMWSRWICRIIHQTY